MFEFDTRIKNEALNFATLMNVTGFSEKKLNPIFTEFERSEDVSIPILERIVEYAKFFEVGEERLK